MTSVSSDLLYSGCMLTCGLLFSSQFAVLMWILTYVGALFNGLTLLILGMSILECSPIFKLRSNLLQLIVTWHDVQNVLFL